jgi:hypothetical protein
VGLQDFKNYGENIIPEEAQDNNRIVPINIEEQMR